VRKGISARFAVLWGLFQMKRLLLLACAMVAIASLSCGAQAQNRAQYETLVATHAKTNLVPEALVHRVIVRESKYRADLVGRGRTIGLMQIKPRAVSVTPATRKACAIPTPISPTALNISPAPIAPPTATTPAPCITTPAAIIMPQSSGGWRASAARHRCLPVRRRRKLPRPKRLRHSRRKAPNPRT